MLKESYINSRVLKAKRISTILSSSLGSGFSALKCLDIGCSYGVITNFLGHNFKEATGIDVKEASIAYAKQNFKAANLDFQLMDSCKMSFEDNSFDVVICNQIYEHVPDAEALAGEIYRVLKKGGCCYFGATNKYTLVEPHFHLPFLSWLPKKLSNLYLKMLGYDRNYNEYNLRSFFGLKRLLNKFDIKDYTEAIIREPKKYNTDDIIKENSLKQKVALFIVKTLGFFLPNYIWIIMKKS